ncbi:phosphotransacetylase family protein [Coleofasciculus sp. G3-WIS-01]|uniref:phosphotransacetylase family protein n=1 Tax=Coleofasciculus sp. G3-WIS-01 TaxID=3069528 RepID=UPI004062C6E7
MTKSVNYLLIGSTEAYSGKSAIILGIAHQLKSKGLDIGYGKLLGSAGHANQLDWDGDDVQFIPEILNLPEKQVRSPLVCLDDQTMQKRLRGEDSTNYRQSLKSYLQPPIGDLMVLEGPSTLFEGNLFDLSLLNIAQEIEASIVLVSRFHSVLLVETLLSAKHQLGDRLRGIVINAIPADQLEIVQSTVQPFLEAQGIPVLGMLPQNDLLRSVTVRELIHQLDAQVLCRPDRIDLLVQSLTIGAMNVNSALKYFRKGKHMAVVTGGDRTDIQMAALETSTHCLILTGKIPPQPLIVNRAEELEIPILSVDLDTLTTVEIIDRAFGQVRLRESIKAQCVQQLMKEHFDIERLMNLLSLEAVVSTH